MDDSINENIAKWLLDTSHTKAQLADALGVSVQTLTNKLKGGTRWYWREVCCIADVLGIDVDQLR